MGGVCRAARVGTCERVWEVWGVVRGDLCGVMCGAWCSGVWVFFAPAGASFKTRTQYQGVLGKSCADIKNQGFPFFAKGPLNELPGVQK